MTCPKNWSRYNVSIGPQKGGKDGQEETYTGATATAADFRALHKLKSAVGSRFSGGVVLYDGETSVRFDGGLYAVPLRFLWEIP